MLSRIIVAVVVILSVGTLTLTAPVNGADQPANTAVVEPIDGATNAVSAQSFRPLPFEVTLDTVPIKYDDGNFLWLVPRVAVVPSLGDNGQPAVIMILQKHLVTSDHYSGANVMRSDDLGRTWTEPDQRPELDWAKDGDVDVAVIDIVPGFHPQSGKVIAIGTECRYNARGNYIEDVKRAHQTSYAVLDPNTDTDTWSGWKRLELPADEQFDFAYGGACQFIAEKDGTVLLPLYIGKNARVPWSATVVRCAFDGKELKYKQHGDVLPLETERGYAEPQLVKFQNRYLMTIRSDSKGYVSVSNDGLTWPSPKPWTFDDGQELGSYNTMQRWVPHSDGLFLVYTRRGANNDHIFRHRAPLFIAQVNPETLQVVRSTERILIHERGATLGNFGTATVTEDESWITVAEGLWDAAARERGVKGHVFVARVSWSKPNRLPISDGDDRKSTTD